MSTQVQPFNWGEIELSQTVLIDGIPHATKTAIGEWLEYADPRVAINVIVDRNPHIDHYSTDIKLISVDGKNRDTKVYHPIGFLLIVMESGQPKARWPWPNSSGTSQVPVSATSRRIWNS